MKIEIIDWFKQKNRLNWIGLTILCFLLFWLQLGKLPLWDQDEPRYYGATRTMLQTGDYIVPLFNGKPRFAKPILFYWLQAGSSKLFGITEFAARVPSALAATLLVLGIFAFALKFLSVNGAFVSAIALAGTIGFVGSARFGTTDAVLNLFIGSSICSFYWGIHSYNKKITNANKIQNRIPWLIGWLAITAAFITKGPVGLVLPFLVICFYLLFKRQLIITLRHACIPTGILLFITLSLPWYVSIHNATSGAFTDQFFLSENVGRFGGKWGHREPWWYFLPILFLFFFPWSAMLPQAWLHSLARGSTSTDPKYSKNDLPISCTIWSLTVIVIFSVSGIKNPQYILPAFPALSMLVGWFWSERNNYCKRGLVFMAGLSLGFGILSLCGPWLIANPFSGRLPFPDLENFTLPFYSLGLMLVSMGACALASAYFNGGLKWVAVLWFVLCLPTIFFLLLPLTSQYRQETLKVFSTKISEALNEKDRLLVVGRDPSSVVYYSHRVATRIGSTRIKNLKDLTDGEKDQLNALFNEPVRVDIISNASIGNELMDIYPLRMNGNHNGYSWISKPEGVLCGN